MKSRSHRFKENAAAALANQVLQANMKTAKGKFVDKRAIAIREIDDFEATREAAMAVRNAVLESLDLWLEKFEANADDDVGDQSAPAGADTPRWRRLLDQQQQGEFPEGVGVGNVFHGAPSFAPNATSPTSGHPRSMKRWRSWSARKAFHANSNRPAAGD